jgi:hypothetical protein
MPIMLAEGITSLKFIHMNSRSGVAKHYRRALRTCQNPDSSQLAVLCRVTLTASEGL